MKQTFNVLENDNVTLYEEGKFSKFLDNINSLNNNLKTEVNIYRSNHIYSFQKASTYLSTVILHLFPDTQPSSGRYGRRRQVNSDGRGGRGDIGDRFEGRRVRGRGGRGGKIVQDKGNRNQSENGVDISNPTKCYGEE